MIFSFSYLSSSPSQIFSKDSHEVDHDRLIDISLLKLSHLQCIGKSRTEKQILFVLEVLQRALYKKSLKHNGETSVADLVFYFEQEIYSAMMRSSVNRLPRLWIDLPGGLEKAKGIKADDLPFRIKASFAKRK